MVVRLLIASLLCSSAAVAADKPNIIYIMADDLGYGDIGCFGQKKILTPSIDKLAAQGTRFTQFYAGSTVCAPTRSVLMTGQHTGHTWVRGNHGKTGRIPLRDEDVTVAEVLKTAGYTTGIVGKWGLGEPDTTGVPNKQGFDFWFGYLNQRRAHSYYTDYLWKNLEKYPIPENADGKREVYSHDLMTTEALGFVERNHDKPFFLYLPYTIPHAKLEVPSDAPYTDKDWPQPQKNHAAMITRMDRDIGRLMDLLDKHNIADNTLVMFTSDNGPHAEGGGKEEFFNSNGPLRGKKRSMTEGGIRVPLVVRWPGKTPVGQTSEHVWAMWDILPTFAAVAGVDQDEVPDNIDGRNMLPALLGKPCDVHEFMYWEFHEGKGMAQAVRMGDWKAIRMPGESIELYDLSNDIDESDNIADKHPDIVAKIEAYLKTARTESEHWPTS